MIHTGDCLDVMPTLVAGSVDAVVTDPPYDLTGHRWDSLGAGIDPKQTPHVKCRGGFMGKAWDGTGIAFSPATWEAIGRVARPGAYLLAFGGTRTVHRMTCAIEDAGWVIRDVLVWAYAQGFPKSRASLKPAWEPIVMARKPGASSPLQIDAARIGTESVTSLKGLGQNILLNDDGWKGIGHRPEPTTNIGRWPANVVLTDPIFDGDVPGVVGGGEQRTNDVGVNPAEYGGSWSGARAPFNHDLSGTYSRFFLVPKADRAEREPVWGDLPLRPGGTLDGGEYVSEGRTASKNGTRLRANHHPTVKPLDLMRHLVRLVTPPGGTVLDPFLGSGTTALACEMEGFPWIGIEREPEYVAIAEARLLGTQRGFGLDVPAPTPEWKPTATHYPVKGPSQSSWFADSTREEETA